MLLIFRETLLGATDRPCVDSSDARLHNDDWLRIRTARHQDDKGGADRRPYGGP